MKLEIGQPHDGQDFPLGAEFVVSGIVVGTDVGGEPQPIESVTVEVDGGRPVAASLGPPPAPAPMTLGLQSYRGFDWRPRSASGHGEGG